LGVFHGSTLEDGAVEASSQRWQRRTAPVELATRSRPKHSRPAPAAAATLIFNPLCTAAFVRHRGATAAAAPAVNRPTWKGHRGGGRRRRECWWREAGGEGESGCGRCAVTHITRLAYTTSSISTSHAAASRAKPRRARDIGDQCARSPSNHHRRRHSFIYLFIYFILLSNMLQCKLERRSLERIHSTTTKHI